MSAKQNPFRKRKAFDAARQAQVLAFTKLGCSRRLAAKMAGFHHTTVGRAARRDPAFAAQLEEAENHVDVASLTRIQEASAENKNWRAAAWVLERRHPEEFGRRAPHSFSCEQVMALLAEIFSFTAPIVPQEEAGNFLRAFNRAMGRVEANAKNADQWQKLAGVNVARGRDGKPIRSPYEHPLWCDPDRPLTYKEEGDETIAWFRSLPEDDADRVREIYSRERAAEKKRPKETRKDRLARLLAAEKAAEAADEKAKAERMEDNPAAAENEVVEKKADEPVAEPAASVEPSPAATEEQPTPLAAAEETGPSVDVGPATPPALASSPEPGAAREEHVARIDGPPTAPPTARKHQTYQEWLAVQEPELYRKRFVATGLEQQATIAPPAADVAGGAYEARLQESCEAMRN